MTKNQNKIISQYINNVKHSLPTGLNDKKNFLKNLSNELNTFFNEHPDFTYETLCKDFGSPESYVDSLISYIPSNELLHGTHCKKRYYLVIGLTIALTIIFAIIFSIFSIWLYGKNNTVISDDNTRIQREYINDNL